MDDSQNNDLGQVSTTLGVSGLAAKKAEIASIAKAMDNVRQFPGITTPKKDARKYHAEELTREEVQKLLDRYNSEPPSHDELALKLAERIAEKKGYPPVGADARFWLCDPDTQIWEAKETEEMVTEAAKLPKGPNCKTLSHYQSITKLLYIHSSTVNGHKDFFGKGNPYRGGIAVGEDFLRLGEDDQLFREPLVAYHRCRYPIPASHVSNDAPWRWLGFLYGALEGDDTQGQIDLLQEVFGATLFGLAADLQQAVLFKGATRAGKGVVSRMLEKLVPESSVSAVSPYQWEDQRSTSRMAGRLLNLVGELEHNKAIHAGVFKSFIGGDQIESAEKYLPGFFHRNTATHVLSSNYFPPTTDHSDAFFERWAILDFPHSVPREKRIPRLEDEIAREELPEILGWAIQGARRVKRNARFSLTATHWRLVEQWGRRANPVLSFLHDREAVELVPGAKTNAPQFYGAFKRWCTDADISKPVGRNSFYDLLNLSKVARHGEDNRGQQVFGVKLPGAETSPFF